MKLKLLIYFAFMLGVSVVSAQDYNWKSVQIANLNSDFSVVNTMTISNTDQKILVGHFSGEVNLWGELIETDKPMGIFLLKFDANDNVLWAKKIAENEGGGTAESPSEFLTQFLLKTDDLGNIHVGFSYLGSVFINSVLHIANENYTNYNSFVVLKYDVDSNFINEFEPQGTCFKSWA